MRLATKYENAQYGSQRKSTLRSWRQGSIVRLASTLFDSIEDSGMVPAAKDWVAQCTFQLRAREDLDELA